MLNSTLHEAGKGFGDNHFVQTQDDYKNYLTEFGQPLLDTSADEKAGKVIPVQLEKPDENLYFCHQLTGGAEHPRGIAGVPQRLTNLHELLSFTTFEREFIAQLTERNLLESRTTAPQPRST